MNQEEEKTIIENLLKDTLTEQRRARRWRIFFRLFWILFTLVAIFYIFINKDKDSIMPTGPEVAVIKLTDIISYENNIYSNFVEGLNSALKNKKTVGVIIRANSPGGSPVYSDLIYREILRLQKLYPKKSIDIVVEEVCASGCYYIASATHFIYANPASIVGSIGVISPNFGVTGLMQKLGIDSRLQIAGKNKAMGYPFIQVNPEQQKMHQEMLDKIHNQFIQAIKNGRGKRLNYKDTELFSGRYWIGEDALKLGLIDGFTSVNELARVKYKSENLVDYTVSEDRLDKIAKKLGLGVATSVKFTLSSILQQINY